MTIFSNPQFIDNDGVRLAVYQAGHPQGLPVMLVHGWPEIAYSWKNQIGPLVDAGFRVIAYDQRGFGQSDAPHDKTLYSIDKLAGDVIAIQNGLELTQAVLCGHDWGGAVVWPTAQLYPDRVLGVIGVCRPHRPPPPVPPLQIIEKRFTNRHYFIRFQEEGLPERTFTGHEEKFFQLMFRGPAPRAAWAAHFPRIYDLIGRFENGPEPGMDDVIISASDLSFFVDAYKKSGFHGGANLYRNVDVNYHYMKDRDPLINHPALWVGAELDMFLPPEGADGMEKYVPNAEKIILPDCGHWVMWEQPDALNAAMIDWLKKTF